MKIVFFVQLNQDALIVKGDLYPTAHALHQNMIRASRVTALMVFHSCALSCNALRQHVLTGSRFKMNAASTNVQMENIVVTSIETQVSTVTDSVS